MQVRGDYFNSLLDTADGTFHNREMLMRLLKASPTGEVVSMKERGVGSSRRPVFHAGKGRSCGKSIYTPTVPCGCLCINSWETS